MCAFLQDNSGAMSLLRAVQLYILIFEEMAKHSEIDYLPNVTVLLEWLRKLLLERNFVCVASDDVLMLIQLTFTKKGVKDRIIE